jgi:hypothetical protein
VGFPGSFIFKISPNFKNKKGLLFSTYEEKILVIDGRKFENKNKNHSHECENNIKEKGFCITNRNSTHIK